MWRRTGETVSWRKLTNTSVSTRRGKITSRKREERAAKTHFYVEAADDGWLGGERDRGRLVKVQLEGPNAWKF